MNKREDELVSAFRRGRRNRSCMWGVVTVGATALVVDLLGCRPESARVADHFSTTAPVALSLDATRRIETFCGDCHALPRPESFPRDRWHFEVQRGYEFYARSGRDDLDPPPLQETLAYYRARAPEAYVIPRGEDSGTEVPVAFQQEHLSLPAGAAALPEIAFMKWTRPAADEEPTLLASDIRHGYLVAIDLKRQGRRPPEILAQVRNPGRVAICDLNHDGHTDFIIADLGSYLPSDHDRGRVVLLQRRPGESGYDATELISGLGRVADVQAADIDRDGQLDLLVAEFGWRKTGSLRWGRNVAQPGRSPQFDWKEVDDRPGVIDVRTHDFTGDGQLDFVALFSQEYESVELFAYRGIDAELSRRIPFARQHVWSAPDLTFGSTGIELVDLNQDGLMDILYTNGDAFDNDYVSPWHGVQWLENQGELRFIHHRLTEMPGAYRALPGDFDGDGKTDILVVASLPPKVQPVSLRVSPQSSIVLLHQTNAGGFARHTLARESPHYVTLEIADFDGDTDLDFVVAAGPYAARAQPAQQTGHFLTIWWNQTLHHP